MNDRRSAVKEIGTLAGVRERDVAGEFLVVGVRREERPGRLVDLGDDVQVLAVARWSERPLVVGEDAQRPRRKPVVRPA